MAHTEDLGGACSRKGREVRERVERKEREGERWERGNRGIRMVKHKKKNTLCEMRRWGLWILRREQHIREGLNCHRLYRVLPTCSTLFTRPLIPALNYFNKITSREIHYAPPTTLNQPIKWITLDPWLNFTNKRIAVKGRWTKNIQTIME